MSCGGGVEHALPARLHLLLTTERAAVEVERLELERRRESRRERPDQVPAEVVPQRLHGSVGESDVERLEEARVVHADRRRRDAEVRRVGAQTERRHERVQLGDVEPVHGQLHVAHLLGGVGRLGQAGLEGEDARGGLLRPLGGVSEVAELPGDVGDVLRRAASPTARRRACSSRARAAPARPGRRRRGRRPSPRSRGRCRASGAGLGPLRCRSRTMSRTSATDAAASMRARYGSRGVGAGGGDRRLVHRRREVVAHHLTGGPARLGPRRGVLQQLVQHVLVARVDDLPRAPGAVLGRDGVGVEPAAVHVPVEVVGCGGVRIEERGVDRAQRFAHGVLPTVWSSGSQSASTRSRRESLMRARAAAERAPRAGPAHHLIRPCRRTGARPLRP